MRHKPVATLSLQGPTHLNEEGECTLQLCDEAPNHLEAGMKQQRYEQVQQAVAQLPAKYSRMVCLRYFEELSYKEVATELRYPVGAVKAHLHQARALMIALMLGRQEWL